MVERAMVPTRRNAVISGVSARKRVTSPMESTPTVGKKASSKTKKTFRAAINKLRLAKAYTRPISLRQLNEHLLQVGLVHIHVPDHDALLVEPVQDLRKPLVGRIHRQLHPSVLEHAAENAGQLCQSLARGRVQLEGDHVADLDLPLEGVGCPARGDFPVLDEGELVAEFLRLAHVRSEERRVG